MGLEESCSYLEWIFRQDNTDTKLPCGKYHLIKQPKHRVDKTKGHSMQVYV